MGFCLFSPRFSHYLSLERSVSSVCRWLFHKRCMQLLWYSIGLFIIMLCQFFYLWTFLLHIHILTILVEADAKYEVFIHSNTRSIFVALFFFFVAADVFFWFGCEHRHRHLIMHECIFYQRNSWIVHSLVWRIYLIYSLLSFSYIHFSHFLSFRYRFFFISRFLAFCFHCVVFSFDEWEFRSDLLLCFTLPPRKSNENPKQTCYWNGY